LEPVRVLRWASKAYLEGFKTSKNLDQSFSCARARTARMRHGPGISAGFERKGR
jgi:hypothetical protein